MIWRRRTPDYGRKGGWEGGFGQCGGGLTCKCLRQRGVRAIRLGYLALRLGSRWLRLVYLGSRLGWMGLRLVYLAAQLVYLGRRLGVAGTKRRVAGTRRRGAGAIRRAAVLRFGFIVERCHAGSRGFQAPDESRRGLRRGATFATDALCVIEGRRRSATCVVCGPDRGLKAPATGMASLRDGRGVVVPRWWHARRWWCEGVCGVHVCPGRGGLLSTSHGQHLYVAALPSRFQHEESRGLDQPRD